MIPLFKVHKPHNVGSIIEEVFDTGIIGEGVYSSLFESHLSSYIGNENISVLNSCTSALTLAYLMCGISAGDEVITTPMTCTATNQPLLSLGATIVFSDIDPETGNIDPNDIRKKITSKTKAIVGVHWGGQPYDIHSINEISNEFSIPVIQDAAHALGAEYDDILIGNYGDFVCFSFQAIKHITTGDGGAICSKSKFHKEKIDKMRWFGIDRKNNDGSRWEQDIEMQGYKFHMNNISASIGLLQLGYLPEIIQKHRSNGCIYDNTINNQKIKLLKRPYKSKSSFWIYSLLINDDPFRFKKYMHEHGIEVDRVHIRNDYYSIFKPFAKDNLLGLNEFSNKLMNIPVGWWLSDKDRDYIVDTVNNY